MGVVEAIEPEKYIQKIFWKGTFVLLCSGYVSMRLSRKEISVYQSRS